MLWSGVSEQALAPEQDRSCSDCSKCLQRGTSAGSTFPKSAHHQQDWPQNLWGWVPQVCFPLHREPSPSPLSASVTIFSSKLEKVMELKAKQASGW